MISTRLLKEHNLPIQIEGFPYIIAGLVLAIACFVVFYGFKQNPEASINSVAVSGFFTVLFSVFTLFSLWFYRCPKIETPNDPNAVFSPANGTVLKVEEVDGKRIGKPRAQKISIFMSPMDVHVNRAPVTGVVEKIQYNKGKFFKADLDKASEENENNWLLMKADRGFEVAFGQIAGFVARRIVCYVDSGVRLHGGERYGMIRFGSRMEVVVPLDLKVEVKPGEKTVAGLTVLARVK